MSYHDEGPYRKSTVCDPDSRLMITSSPKAGTTFAMRVMLARLNLTSVAYAYGMYPGNYIHSVFNRQPGNVLPRDVMMVTQNMCGNYWQCISIVRNPLDRAVSAYIQTMKYRNISLEFTELRYACGAEVADCQQSASFWEFTRALHQRARSRSKSTGDGHFMPQAWNTSWVIS